MGDGISMEKLKNIKDKSVFIPFVVLVIFLVVFGIILIMWIYEVFDNWRTDLRLQYTFEIPGIELPDGTIVRDTSNILQLYSNKDMVKNYIFFVTPYIAGALYLLFVFKCLQWLYNKYITEPINQMLDAAEKIKQNDLDFYLKSTAKNEFGILLEAFERIRLALVENNRSTWVKDEQRKLVNRAFIHDVRTPLTILKGNVEYFSMDEIDPKKLEILSIMEKQIERLTNYVEEMSTLNKLEERQAKIAKVNVLEWEQEVKNLAMSMIIDKDIQFNSKSTVDNVYLDKYMIQEILENILSNAIRYAENNINIALDINDTCWSIRISNDGKPFTEDELRFAKSLFYKEKANSVENVASYDEHTGIGLYLSELYAKKHGGSLDLVNAPDATVIVKGKTRNM